MATTIEKKRKKKKRTVEPLGVAHIKATFNNTHITLSDQYGNVVAWSTAGTSGFKGSRKSTAYAATLAAQKAAKVAMAMGLTTVEVKVKATEEGDDKL